MFELGAVGSITSLSARHSLAGGSGGVRGGARRALTVSCIDKSAASRVLS